MALSMQPGANRIRLAPRLDLAAAAPLHAALLAARGEALDIDLSEVERIGAPCAQILLSAKLTWAADGAPLVFDSPSPEACAQLAQLGMSQMLLDAAACGEDGRESSR